MTHDDDALPVEAVGSPLQQGVVRQEPERIADGMPASADERHLRRVLAARVAMPYSYFDDGEAQGHEHGIAIDFMREPVADIDAKLRTLNVARLACSKPSLKQDQIDAIRMVLHHYGADPRILPLAELLDAASREPPNVGGNRLAPTQEQR